jgi:hypothetical protein
MREIRTLRATWRGLETWNGQIATAAGAPVLDPTDERGRETGQCYRARPRLYHNGR